MPLKLIHSEKIVAGIILLIVAFVYFFNTIPFGFFSDDFDVMYRLAIDNQFWGPGFFRPLSDASLLTNYYLSGFNASAYRITNVILHALNAFILYKTLLLANLVNPRLNGRFAMLAALLFVSYPFHSESIIWIVGRASLLANTFGILALYFFVCNIPTPKKELAVCACYFIGLLSYESIAVIPGIVFVVRLARGAKLNRALLTMIPFIITLTLHLLVRKLFSGVIFGNYGIDMFGEGQTNYAFKYLKSFLRLFVPGTQINLLLSIAFACIVLLIAISVYTVYRYKIKWVETYLTLWLLLLIAQIVPGVFGIDTHTSDGDRLLYFPSFFLCTIIAFYIIQFVTGKKNLVLICTLLLGVNFYLQQLTNHNWKEADTTIKHIIGRIKIEQSKNKLYLANIPDANAGSFIFRNGFKEALAINGLKDDHVVVLNYLLNRQSILLPDTIRPQKLRKDNYFIAPAIRLDERFIHVIDTSIHQTSVKLFERNKENTYLYWNKHELVQFP